MKDERYQVAKRGPTKPQDDYCRDCIHYQMAGCNVILKDDEDECEDKIVLTCKNPNCQGHEFEVVPELYDEGYSLECTGCGNTYGQEEVIA